MGGLHKYGSPLVTKRLYEEGCFTLVSSRSRSSWHRADSYLSLFKMGDGIRLKYLKGSCGQGPRREIHRS
jgi:hypothetical protein